MNAHLMHNGTDDPKTAQFIYNRCRYILQFSLWLVIIFILDFLITTRQPMKF